MCRPHTSQCLNVRHHTSQCLNVRPHTWVSQCADPIPPSVSMCRPHTSQCLNVQTPYPRSQCADTSQCLNVQTPYLPVSHWADPIPGVSMCRHTSQCLNETLGGADSQCLNGRPHTSQCLNVQTPYLPVSLCRPHTLGGMGSAH